MLWKEGERGEGRLCTRGAFLYHQWFITKARPRPDGHCMSGCVRPQTFQNTKFECKTFCVAVCVCSKLSKYIWCVLVLIDQLRKSFFWFDKFTAVQWITSAQFSNYSLKMVKWPLNVRTWWRCAWSSWEDKWLPNGRSMFIPRCREKRTDGGSEQRLLLLRQQFGEKETEGCCRWAKQCQRLQNSLKRLLAGWFRCQGELLPNSL